MKSPYSLQPTDTYLRHAEHNIPQGVHGALMIYVYISLNTRSDLILTIAKSSMSHKTLLSACRTSLETYIISTTSPSTTGKIWYQPPGILPGAALLPQGYCPCCIIKLPFCPKITPQEFFLSHSFKNLKLQIISQVVVEQPEDLPPL